MHYTGDYEKRNETKKKSIKKIQNKETRPFGGDANNNWASQPNEAIVRAKGVTI